MPATRRDLAPRPPVTTILTVANLRAEKAHEVLARRRRRSFGRGTRYLRYLIAGDGPRLAELETLASSLGLDGIVRFLGHREEVPALLADADVFVLPSRSEAFPNGAIEAMAAGLPVVASRVGGLLDLIDEGRTGLLVGSGRSRGARRRDRIAGALAGARPRCWAPRRGDEVARRYSFDRMVRGFEDLYLSQLHAAGAPADTPGRASLPGRPRPCAASPDDSTTTPCGPWRATSSRP